jgi:hypothetical protein
LALSGIENRAALEGFADDAVSAARD